MKIVDALKPWMARFDRLSLRDRAGLVAAAAAVLYFVLSLVLVEPEEARSVALKKRIEAQKTEREAVRKEIGELSVLLERDPNAPQLAQLEGLKRTIAEADAVLAELDRTGHQAVKSVLKELLATTPGLEMVSLRTLPVTVAFQSKVTSVTPAKPAPTGAPAPGAKVDHRNPITRAGIDNKKLTSGPPIATSNNIRRCIRGDRRRMNAPNVPTIEKYGGNGMK